MGWLELIINIKPSLQEGFKNGASSGTRHEPSYAELAQLCLHAKNTIEQVREFLQIGIQIDIP